MSIDLRQMTSGIIGNGQTPNDGMLIQQAIDQLANTVGGGHILTGPGVFLTNELITVRGNVTLIGEGDYVSQIVSPPDGDIGVLRFDGNVNRGGLRDIGIAGRLQSNGSQNAVTVDYNAMVIFRDCSFLGGACGLAIWGTDGTIDNCVIYGYGAGIYSQGANWYRRVKIDLPNGVHTQYAFFQDGVPVVNQASIFENHFDFCDFSGDYDNSIIIDDGGSATAVTHISECVTSAPTLIRSAHKTNLLGNEIGAPITLRDADAGVLIINANEALCPAFKIAGHYDGQIVGAGNDGISW